MRNLIWPFIFARIVSTHSTYHPPPTAITRNGTIQGVHLPSFQQDLFLGIPYAQAPRLDNPKPINTTYDHDTPFDASRYGNTCYGFGSNELLGLTQSEDCLNLNIIRPSRATADSLPVLVWLYGGGLHQGSSADPMWNMSYIVQRSVIEEQPMIAVSLNYRLSFLGFPGGSEALNAGVTNLGLKDQRLALAWIQENIVAFGGDPARVTVWGESAGGVSVVQQLIAYGGHGGAELFSGAIIVSGFATGAALPEIEQMQAGFDKLVVGANCSMAEDKLDCLRGTSLYNMYPIEGSTEGGWGPVIDGEFLRRPAAWEIHDGNCARVPLLLGSNSDEGLIKLTASEYFPNSTNETTTLLKSNFPLLQSSVIEQLLSLYPEDGQGEAPPYSLPPDFPWCKALHAANLPCGSQYRRAAALLGDYVSHAPRRYMARLWSRLGLPTYSFHFKAAVTGVPIQFFYGLGPGFANHGAELAYEMGLPGGFTTPIRFYPPVKNVSGHVALSMEMNRRWIAFVARRDPNQLKDRNSSLKWSQYETSASNFVFDATDEDLNLYMETDDYRERACQIWTDNVAYTDYSGQGL
ncbi:uncharacterized protein N7477_000853 [Penicillium maclennaniae]|uniref:uncharacterized protein n=1 Tax=Penicillium maclennaniae TaxID=1343394 RepID=UPI002540E9C5|nr:uncharacterized protein N7477_000853 [Penicillium maclennaniae]KAJ5684508.1 hypothetical protein N7477_000853 [Penicillium maclennaniae]